MQKNFCFEDETLLEAKIAAAKEIITSFREPDHQDEKQHALLASAHYTLTEESSVSLKPAKMHINSAITLLQAIKNKDINIYLQLAYSYSRRAEICESENEFSLAITDYERALDIFECYYVPQMCFDAEPDTLEELGLDAEEFLEFQEDNIMHMAHCAISIADLLVNEEVNPEPLKNTQALHYVNVSLEHLARLPRMHHELWSTLSFVHYIAGLALFSIDTEDAIEAHRTALAMAFKSETFGACHLLGDIYHSMAVFYESQASAPIQKNFYHTQETAAIYFQLASFFSTVELDESDDCAWLINSLFDAVYRVLDPYSPSLSDSVVRDFIDALVFGYFCVADGLLPNQTLCQKLQQQDLSNTYAQHIHWLVAESFYNSHPNCRLLRLAETGSMDINSEIAESFDRFMELESLKKKGSQNILHFPTTQRMLEKVPG